METPVEYTLTPAHTIKPANVAPQESFTAEQIDVQQDTLSDLKEQLENLQLKIRLAKDTLYDMATHAAIPQDDFRAWIFRMYWTSDVKATILRQAVKERMGDAHHSWTSIIEGSMPWACDRCGTLVDRTFSSRTALTDARSKNYKSFLCPECEAKKEEQNRARHQAWEAEHIAQAERLEELRSMPYQEYLQSPEWDATRKAALKRAHYRCQLCNSNGQLHVHHKTYERLGTEYTSDLIVLCRGCHAKFHDKEPQ